MKVIDFSIEITFNRPIVLEIVLKTNVLAFRRQGQRARTKRGQRTPLEGLALAPVRQSA
jgi:hypothetical protein